jgi:hypothetical protein
MSVHTIHFHYFSAYHTAFSLLLSVPSSISAILFTANHGNPFTFLKDVPWTSSVSFHASSGSHSSTPYIILDSHNIIYISSNIQTLTLGVAASHLSRDINASLLFASIKAF